MRIKVKWSDIEYVLFGFYMFISILFESSTISLTYKDSEIFGDIIKFIFCICTIIRFFKIGNFTTLSLIKIILCGLILAFASVLSENATLFTPFVFSLAIYNLDYKKIAKTVIIVLNIIIPTIMILAIIGIIPNGVSYSTYGGTYRVRYGMGFGHPNAFSAQIIQYILAWISYKWDTFCKKDYFIIIVLTSVCFYFSQTKTLIYISLITILIIWIIKSKYINSEKIINLFSHVLIVMCPLITIFFMHCYSDKYSILAWLNILSTGRIQLVHSFYEAYGLELFARKIELTNWSENGPLKYAILDNAYGQLFIIYGILAAIVYLYAYYVLLRNSLKSKHEDLIAIVMILCIYGLMETYIFRLPYNFTMVIAYSTLIYGNKSFCYKKNWKE